MPFLAAATSQHGTTMRIRPAGQVFADIVQKSTTPLGISGSSRRIDGKVGSLLVRVEPHPRSPLLRAGGVVWWGPHHYYPPSLRHFLRRVQVHDGINGWVGYLSRKKKAISDTYPLLLGSPLLSILKNMASVISVALDNSTGWFPLGWRVSPRYPSV